MAEFFRFKSIDALLGKRKELKKQTIYFASPEELNDPMEGSRDLVWNGDKIVWTNFFKHYVFCLNRSYLMLNIAREPRKLDADSIPILERWDEIITPIEKSLFDDVWNRFCRLPYIQEIIEALANTSRKIRYREIISYLQSIQTFGLLDEIRASYINHKLIPEFQVFPPLKEQAKATGMKMLHNAIKENAVIEDEHTLDALDAIFQVTETLSNNIRLTVPYNTRTFPAEILESMDRLLMLDFPKIYVEQLEKLLWPKWYTACFTKSYHNSSVWAKYADSHKGVCLIFEAIEKDNSNLLELNQETGNRSITLPFYEVNYAHKPGEIDFFRTICRMTVSALKKLWYTDQDGNLSECAAHIGSDCGEATWRDTYWNNLFRDVTFKTKDWAYEQEYRLIIENTSGQFNEKDDRKLTYEFDSLKGIIFGMRTSTEDKMKIIEIIKEKKCDRNNQNDFQFFQADYSAKDGEIRTHRVQLQ